MYLKVLFSFLFVPFIAHKGYAEAKNSQLLPATILDKVRDATFKCISELNFGTDIIKGKAKPSHFTEGDSLKSLLYCSLVKSGFGNVNGHIKLEKTAKHFPTEVQTVIEECDKHDEKDPLDGVHLFVTCFDEKSPISYIVVPTF